jgi:hypothetical protein
VAVDETPAAFEELVRAAVAYLRGRPDVPPVLTIGCWNEWTEGHYLLPDTRLGYGMPRALARGLGVTPGRSTRDASSGSDATSSTATTTGRTSTVDTMGAAS